MPDVSPFFRLNDRSADPAAQYEDGFRLIEAAERLGFDGAWITSHHFASDKGSIASPLLYLAAAAQRTRRIRLGAGVVVLSLEDPIRVAEDAALADVLAGGRLQLGLGTGLENWAFEAFDVDWQDRHRLFAAKQGTLRRVLSGAELPGGRRLHPPGNALLDRIWRVGTELDDIRRIALDGDNLLLGSSKQLTLSQNRARHRRAIAEFRELGSSRQRIAVSRALFVDEDGAKARRLFHDALPEPVRAKRGSSEAPFESEEPVLVGSPGEVRAALGEDDVFAAVDEVLVQTLPAKFTLDRWIGSLALLATAVFPPGSSLRRPAQPIEDVGCDIKWWPGNEPVSAGTAVA